MNEEEALKLKIEKIKALEIKVAHQRKLPHLFSQKFYAWQRDFFETTNPMALLTAANQIGKSTIQIRKVIELASNPAIWAKFWPKQIAQGKRPNLFWYMYPSKEVATLEFKTKWEPLLPQDDYKEHPVWGWKHKEKNGNIEWLRFNTGVTIVFKVYEMDAQNLQTATVWYVAGDEEMPYELYPEISARTQAIDGIMSMVFTATLGQEEWRLAMEPLPSEHERFPGAFKRQVSMYDCMLYEDGTPGQYDEEKIQRAIARCGTAEEVLRRVFGKFVKSTGRRYAAFSAATNLIEPRLVPFNWKKYCGIDSGAGGEASTDSKDKADPAAIVFVAVSPDFAQGYVYKTWRGDNVLTTSSDIIQKYLEMRGTDHIDLTVYDFADKDLHTIATRMGEGFIRADKGRDRGDGILNTLFKNKFLYLFNEGEIGKLVSELLSLKVGATKMMDHLSDALRYVCVAITWDFSKIVAPSKTEVATVPVQATAQDLRDLEIRMRRGEGLPHDRRTDDIEAEFDEINELAGW
jgi:phage terminase large subunit-like protein